MPHLRVDPPVTGTSMAERVRALRHRLGLGRPQLARRLGVSRQYVTKLEAGTMPSRPVLLLMEHLERGAISSPACASSSIVRNSTATSASASTAPPLRLLPVMTLSQVGGMASPIAQKPTAPRHLAFATEDVHAFALRLDEDSECSPDLEKCIAVVSPAARIRNGDLVAVRLKGSPGAPALLRLYHGLGAEQGATLTALRSDIPSVHVVREQVRWMAPVVVTLRYPGSSR